MVWVNTKVSQFAYMKMNLLDQWHSYIPFHVRKQVEDKLENEDIIERTEGRRLGSHQL